ncbi:MAG: dihydropteroate synthase [Desulfobacterales bacterium]|jgi:dihydropteroate synthase
MKTYTLSCNSHRLILGERTAVMGVVNVTPDSFSDGGEFFSFETAVAQGEKLAREGADVIDVGGESTRPFSEPVSVDEEMRRVVAVIETLAKRITVPISIDTTKAAVAKRAIEAGASIINDVGALRLDPGLADVAADYGVPIILMHMLGTPKTMQISPVYDDLISEIKLFLEDAIQRALDHGVPKGHIIIDPGLGFGKTVAHNLRIIKHLQEFETLDAPILIGPSRKTFIRKLLKDPNTDDIRPSLPIVETGTQATVCAAAMNGAHIVRVHDVASTRATIKIVDAIKNA